MSDQEFDFDVIVIGAGSAGYAAARTTGKAGLKTALVDGARELGGLCILRGCMPTKALLHVSEMLHHARYSTVLGIRPGDVRFDFAEIMRRKDRLILDFAEYRRQQLQTGPFTFIHEYARFADPHTLELASGKFIRGRHFILCTGSTVAPPPLPQLLQLDYLTSDDALELQSLPKSLIVLGGGAVGVELTQFFARMDVRVTLIQRSAHILHEFDADAATELEKVLQREGVQLFTSTRLLDCRNEPGRKTVRFEQRGEPLEVSAEEVLFALGRIPNTRLLALDRAGVEREGERIRTSLSMQTSAPHIYAAGDCRGHHEIVHLAIQQAEIAAHNILFPDQVRTIDYRLLTTVIFSDPQVARVGLTEREAKAAQIPYRVAKHPFNDHGKANIMEANDGFVKLLADPVSGEILGGGIVGMFGGELIHEIIAAMVKRMTVHELALMPHFHPTLAEIWTYPAEELAEQIPIGGKSPTSPSDAS